MKNTLLLVLFALFLNGVFGQNNLADPIKDGAQYANYVLGVGDKDYSSFESLKAFLDAEDGVKIQKSCPTHQVLLVEVNNAEYKSYDVLENTILSQFPLINLHRKSEDIFDMECNQESLKP